MRFTITGASGSIGSAVVDVLIARGDQVAGLTRSPERSAQVNPNVEWHRWDPTAEPPPPESLAGSAAVLNLIGESLDQRWTEKSKPRMRASRVDSTRNLVAGIAALNPADRPGALISQAAVGYYGDRGDDVLTESEPPGKNWAATLVRDWEAAAQPAAELGLRVATIRSGLILDPEAGLLDRLLLPFKLGVGGPLAGGDWYMSWIHRDDETALLVWALDGPAASGPINSTAPNPVTNRELGKALGRALHRPAIFPAPKLAVAVLMGSEAADALVGSLRVVPARAQELGFEFAHPDLDEALADLLG